MNQPTCHETDSSPSDLPLHRHHHSGFGVAQAEHSLIHLPLRSDSQGPRVPLLRVEIEGDFLVILMNNVKHIEIVPAPEQLPEGVIRETRHVATSRLANEA